MSDRELQLRQLLGTLITAAFNCGAYQKGNSFSLYSKLEGCCHDAKERVVQFVMEVPQPNRASESKS